MSPNGEKARSALYRNNGRRDLHRRDQAVWSGYPCWAMGAAVDDSTTTAGPTCSSPGLNGVVLYRNNGNGTFTDVTTQGLAGDHGWATGASFADYDGDGYDDLFVPYYAIFHLHHLPNMGSSQTCEFYGIEVRCGPKGLPGEPDNLYRNNRDGTLTDVSAKASVDDPRHRYGLTSVWSDVNHDGHLDMLVANDTGPNYLYINNGANHFADGAIMAGVGYSQNGLGSANLGVALGDYRHTGRFGIAITHFSGKYTSIYRNDGNLDFTDASYSSGIAQATRHYASAGATVLLIWTTAGGSTFLRSMAMSIRKLTQSPSARASASRNCFSGTTMRPPDRFSVSNTRCSIDRSRRGEHVAHCVTSELRSGVKGHVWMAPILYRYNAGAGGRALRRGVPRIESAQRPEWERSPYVPMGSLANF